MRFSSPQRGSFLSTAIDNELKRRLEIVFVPSTGLFSIYKEKTSESNVG